MTERQAPEKPGWYGGLYWDGANWIQPVDPPRPTQRHVPESPWGWVGGGIGLTIAGFLGVALGFDGDSALVVAVGYLLAGLGTVLTLVGVIALGVRLGGQHLDYERERRSS